MMALAAMQHMKMPIWNFQKHLVKQARLYTRAPAAAEIAVAESSAQRFVFNWRNVRDFPRPQPTKAPSPHITQ